MSGSMSGRRIAPALSAIGEDLSIGDAETQLTLSIFVLAFCLWPSHSRASCGSIREKTSLDTGQLMVPNLEYDL